MATTINIHEAKTRLSQLIEQVERGEQVTIARAGKPVAKLVAARAERARPLGKFRGRITIPEGFDDPLPGEMLDAFGARSR